MSLRLVPIFPFFLVNLCCALTRIPAAKFFLFSQLGMFPATLIFVNAGAQLSSIRAISDIASVEVLGSLALLGLLPWIVKFVSYKFYNLKKYKGHTKPKSFDYNLIVIGAGSGGLVSSYVAASIGARVLLIEKHLMGGDCLNTGCVPSKALIHAANTIYETNHESPLFGQLATKLQADFHKVMAYVQARIAEVAPHDSVERYTSLGVECLSGTAKILNPYSVEVDGKIFTSPKIILATGASPHIPEIKGLESAPYYTSDTIWGIEQQPKKLAVLGGGPIGLELAQAFSRTGSEVTILLRSKILSNEDLEVQELVESKLVAEGIKLQKGFDCHQAHIEQSNGVYTIIDASKENAPRFEFDALLIATGRTASTKNLGNLDFDKDRRGFIEVDESLKTSWPHIYAVGDINGIAQFTHAAGFQGAYASLNALLGLPLKAKNKTIPACTYTSPEIARIGITEKQAQAKGLDYQAHSFPMHELDRAIVDNTKDGFIKIITPKTSDKILGVTLVGKNAGEIIHEYILAMDNKIGLKKLMQSIHIYPTFAEINRYGASEWRKANSSPKAIGLLRKFFSWRRGGKKNPPFSP